jgi:Tfp pilus assembly protein PilN
MLRTNLATSPFYNDGAVRVMLGAVALLVLAASIFTASQWVGSSRRDAEQASRAAADESRSAELQRDARQLRTSVNGNQIQIMATEAERANGLIDRRTFSWTELFNRFEVTIPADVRITSVRQHVDRDRGSILTVGVAAHDVGEINRFMQNLEDTGVFVDLLAQDEATTETGEVEAVIATRYRPMAAAAPEGASR